MLNELPFYVIILDSCFFFEFFPIGEKDLLNRCITLQSFFGYGGKQKVFFVIILLS